MAWGKKLKRIEDRGMQGASISSLTGSPKRTRRWGAHRSPKLTQSLREVYPPRRAASAQGLAAHGGHSSLS